MKNREETLKEAQEKFNDKYVKFEYHGTKYAKINSVSYLNKGTDVLVFKGCIINNNYIRNDDYFSLEAIKYPIFITKEEFMNQVEKFLNN